MNRVPRADRSRPARYRARQLVLSYPPTFAIVIRPLPALFVASINGATTIDTCRLQSSSTSSTRSYVDTMRITELGGDATCVPPERTQSCRVGDLDHASNPLSSHSHLVLESRHCCFNSRRPPVAITKLVASFGQSALSKMHAIVYLLVPLRAYTAIGQQRRRNRVKSRPVPGPQIRRRRYR